MQPHRTEGEQAAREAALTFVPRRDFLLNGKYVGIAEAGPQQSIRITRFERTVIIDYPDAVTNLLLRTPVVWDEGGID